MEEQPVRKRAALVADGSVQRMAGIVTRVQLHADHRTGPPNELNSPSVYVRDT